MLCLGTLFISIWFQQISGMMFYIPHWLWKIYEDGRLQKITSSLQGRTLDIETRKGQLEVLVKYVKGKKISNSVNFFSSSKKWEKKNPSNFAHLFWKVRSKCGIIFALKGIVSIHISIIWWTWQLTPTRFLTCSWHQKTKPRIHQITNLKCCMKAREPFKPHF